MNQLYQNPSRSLRFILIFYAVFSFIGLGSWGVIESSEARYAEISREMIISNDWMNPTLLGIHHYHKPPLTYWITSIGYSVFGVNAFGARFFLVISFLVQITLVFHIASNLFRDQKVGLLSAIVYSSLPMILLSVRGLTTDAYLNTFALAALACWLKWRMTFKPGWLYLAALSLGAAFLCKGPVVLIVPVLVMIGSNNALQAERSPFAIHHLMAIILFFAIALSWFAVLVYRNYAFVDYFLFRHTVERFANADVFTRKQPWWFYLAYGPLLTLPWLLILPVAYKFYKSSEAKTPALLKRIFIFWILIPLFFFSLSSSKLVPYILPIYSGVAIITGWYLKKLEDVGSLKPLDRNLIVYICFISLVLLVAPFIIKEVQLPLWAAVVPISSILVLFLVRKAVASIMEKITVSVILFTGFLLVFSSIIFNANELDFNSTAPIARWIKENKPESRVIVYDRLLPSLAFHLNKDIISVSDGNHYLNREIQFEENEQWKASLFNLKESEDEIRLKSVMQPSDILVVKGDLQTERSWLGKYFTNKQIIGKWIIFYN